MKQENIWQEFNALPPQAQQLVAEFITFLRKSYRQIQAGETFEQTELAEEEFVGMWRDREDLADSTAWIRQVRQTEWIR